jgi:2,3-bisphosphoglycerate-dependent phosphoglycerate mutase
MSKLVLLRHGQSVWNKKNLFTGWVNIGLSAEGIEEALHAGQELKSVDIDVIYVSSLIRAQQTAMIAMAKYNKNVILVNQYNEKKEWMDPKNIEHITMYEDSRLNERYYGDLQGLNKAETIEKYGKEQVHIWRRSYDTPPPNGESLAMTAERSLPAFYEKIKPQLKAGKNVLVVAHGNSLRSIIMDIEKLSSEEITSYEIPTGKPLYYKYDNGIFSPAAK